MTRPTFRTNPEPLQDILKDCNAGKIQLPDFQRGWVWDEDRIKSLIASISCGFPVGALMTLESGGQVKFKPRGIEGTPGNVEVIQPQRWLLDGQQRMTSLYQAMLSGNAVKTVPGKNKVALRWFYIDIRKAMNPDADRDEAIIGVPEDKILRPLFGRNGFDLSTAENEYKFLMFPLSEVFHFDSWQDGFLRHWPGDFALPEQVEFRAFKNDILKNFELYQLPVITLDSETSKEAVAWCSRR